MSGIVDHPILVLIASFVIQWLAAWAGDSLRRTRRPGAGDDAAAAYGTVLPAALTLLGLIIGFSFSMAVSRYDLRKNYEEAEANAIGTEYVRADLLPGPVAAEVRGLLTKYTQQRILFYELRDGDRLRAVNSETANLQTQLWSAITPAVRQDQNPVTALVASGMNDVLNAQGYTQAAWWNRIPPGAWLLLELVAVACNVLFGYSERRRNRIPLMVLPLIVAVSLFLIADIDSPRGGLIRVLPQNLIALAGSLGGG